MTLFDCLSDIIRDKSGTLHQHEDFKKTWSTYMILRYLSMDSEFQPIATEMNKYQQTLTSEQMYLFLVKVIPYRRSTFIKYIKSKKKAETKKK